ncbi:hypothetical protein LEN26_001056 [Aphanomyces euteiches]|nr:hypothetical protein LEN26_001056 [Aphanomyces euteiches]
MVARANDGVAGQVTESLDAYFEDSGLDQARTWSRGLLQRVKSVILYPFDPFDSHLPSRLVKYKASLHEYVHQQRGLSRELELELARLDERWPIRLHKLASQGTSRRVAEQYRFLSHLLLQDARLRIAVQVCILQILEVRLSECDAFLGLVSGTPNLSIDQAFFKPPTALIAAHPEIHQLQMRQDHLSRAISRAYSAIVPESDSIQDLLNAMGACVEDVDGPLPLLPKSPTTFATLLNAFRRAVSDVRTASGRLLRTWQKKLHDDVERVVVKEEGNFEDHATWGPLLQSNRVFFPRKVALSECVPAVDTSRLPPPALIAAFEKYLVRRIEDEFDLHSNALLRTAVHYALFSHIAKVTSAYEDTFIYRHLSHIQDASYVPCVGVPSKLMEHAQPVMMFPTTRAALVELSAEVTPLAILASVLRTMRCLHDEAQPWCFSVNADVLIPLLVLILSHQTQNLATWYRRLHVGATFASAYVTDGAEVVYYLTCMQAAISHIHASTINRCHVCCDSSKSWLWRDLGSADESPSTSQSDAQAIAELSSWIQHYTVSDSTLAIVSDEEWMV